MKVFCPNCGTDNEGMPGGRLTCKACTATFEVPREGGVSPQPAPLRYPPPPAPVASQPTSSAPFPGFVGPAPTGFGSTGGSIASGQPNPLAIISLVLGILCCIPFASTAAIVTGVIAQNQINASNGQQRGKELALAGIILGSASLVLFVIGLILNVVMKLR